MAALKAALAAIERHIGFPTSRTTNVARRLQEAGMLPFGAPGLAPQIDIGDFATFVIAVATDTGLRTTADVTRRYSNLPPDALPMAGVPAEFYPRCAHDWLCILVDHAVYGDQTSDLTTGTQIDFVLNWAEIAFRHRDGEVRRFQPVGSTPGYWQGHQHRRAVTINGLALHYAARAIFPKE